MAEELGIEVMVAIPAVASQAPDPAYNVETFSYYNLRRIINILGKEVLQEYLKMLAFSFLIVFYHIRAILSRSKISVFDFNINPLFLEHPANRLIFTGNLTEKTGF